MGTTIYNLDLVEREVFKIQIAGQEHEIKEPTVAEFARIQQLDFQEDKEAVKKLLGIMCPELDTDNITVNQLNMMTSICFKIISGNGKKKVEIEEIMQ